MFNRAPDQGGLEFWSSQAQTSGLTDFELMDEIAAGFAQHPAFEAIYGNLNNAAFVEELYFNIGGNLGDTQGQQFWVDRLDSGELRSDIVADFTFGILTADLSEENFPDLLQEELVLAQMRQDQLKNRVEVSLAYIEQMGVQSNLSPSTDPLDIDSLMQDLGYLSGIAVINDIGADPILRDERLSFLSDNPNLGEIISLMDYGVIANDDTATVVAGEPTIIDVLANDSNPGGDPLTITSVTQGNHGNVAIINDGSELRYTPSEVYSSEDYLEYTISDNQGNESTAKVNIDIESAGEYDDIFNFTDHEMSIARRLSFTTSGHDSESDRHIHHLDVSARGEDDIFLVELKESYNYDIMTASFFEPKLYFGIGDKNGIMLNMDSSSNSDYPELPDLAFGGASYPYRFINSFEAPYTGDYYIQAAWDLGIYNDNGIIGVFEYEPDYFS